MKDNQKRVKMAVIAGAARAIRFKERKPRATEEEIIQHVTKDMDGIIGQIDKDLG